MSVSGFKKPGQVLRRRDRNQSAIAQLWLFACQVCREIARPVFVKAHKDIVACLTAGDDLQMQLRQKCDSRLFPHEALSEPLTFMGADRCPALWQRTVFKRVSHDPIMTPFGRFANG